MEVWIGFDFDFGLALTLVWLWIGLGFDLALDTKVCVLALGVMSSKSRIFGRGLRPPRATENKPGFPGPVFPFPRPVFPFTCKKMRGPANHSCPWTPSWRRLDDRPSCRLHSPQTQGSGRMCNRNGHKCSNSISLSIRKKLRSCALSPSRIVLS